MGEENLEDKILNKKISFSIKDLKWVIITGVSVVLWIVTVILWVTDKDNQKIKIKNLEESKVSLEKQVATLQGQIKGVENASIIFMQNPPSELKFRIDLLEKKVNSFDLPFNNRITNIDTNKIKRREH